MESREQQIASQKRQDKEVAKFMNETARSEWNGKGSRQRTLDHEKYKNNFDKIDWSKK